MATGDPGPVRTGALRRESDMTIGFISKLQRPGGRRLRPPPLACAGKRNRTRRSNGRISLMPSDETGDCHGHSPERTRRLPKNKSVPAKILIVDDEEVQAEETASFFAAFQIDPEAEDTAGPKFLLSADMDRDGLLDLVSGWNQSQPVQLHLQRRDAADNISFRTITLAGTSPLAVIAGVHLLLGFAELAVLH